ncbi:MAG TPA: tyrosine--tRNA ligase [Acidimicrobiia bacterium]|jgi:tyrosyl-tRNA synthetase|nr:tyrosine--tRNA ligase [Acidimicrobiia bacterium]
MTADPLQRILRHTDKVVPENELADKLNLERPLRIKLGLDPTAPAVTLGWAVVLRKLREFQELGHTAVLIVGDFTAQVGDPSERGAQRKRLTADEVNGYAENVLAEFGKVLLDENLEIRRNSEWLAGLDMYGLLELTAAATVAQMMERSDFAMRFDAGVPISVMEFLYPLLQGYDSVAVEADIELGGSDQLWNLMMGRIVQERYGQTPQVALTMPLLVGTDGTEKMSQSVGNYIGVTDSPTDMFGKTMSIPDEVMGQWFRLAANYDDDAVVKIEKALQTGEIHPNEAKRHLARSVVILYWGEEAAGAAEEEFDRVFRRGGVPDEVEDFQLPGDDPVHLPGLIRDVFGLSGSEARRLIDQGAVRVDDSVVEDFEISRGAAAGKILRVGKRRFARLVG